MEADSEAATKIKFSTFGPKPESVMSPERYRPGHQGGFAVAGYAPTDEQVATSQSTVGRVSEIHFLIQNQSRLKHAISSAGEACTVSKKDLINFTISSRNELNSLSESETWPVYMSSFSVNDSEA